ncbi:unnamed protein product [Ambrosiozyma monospora]|uniref:Unnamed protein product n=1 Tax=Ambrosiozyma monospora TaxID=43982 RepID=A0ACB5TCE4_AMBMO|nr:unnamed protein product [Ambrosiozyma monospora]
MAKPRLIILVRHGESQGNRDKSVNRYTPNHKVPLTERGHCQARAAGDDLRSILKPDDSVCFYTSPYMRARQTMNGIIDGIKDTGVQYKIYEEPRMREQDFGNFQGTAQEMEDMWNERAEYGHFFYRIPHGESAADVYDRCASFNETLFRQFNKANFPSVLVLVTHGIWARVFLTKWFRWSVEYFEDLQNVPHCKLIRMERQDEHNQKYKLIDTLARWSDMKRPEWPATGGEAMLDEMSENEESTPELTSLKLKRRFDRLKCHKKPSHIDAELSDSGSIDGVLHEKLQPAHFN